MDTKEPHTDGARPRRWGRMVALVTLCAMVLALFRVALAKGSEVEAELAGGRDNLYVSLLWWCYAKDNDGLLPALDPAPGRLTFDRAGVHPGYTLGNEYLGATLDPKIPILFGELNNRPGYVLDNLVDDSRQFYLGYAMLNEEQGMAFIDAYRKRLAEGGDFTGDLPVAKGQGTLGADVLYRLNQNLPERLTPAAQAAGLPGISPTQIPVMIERPGHYGVSGGWVVYLNRQMVFLPYPGPFPMTEKFIKALEELSGQGPDHPSEP